MHTLSEFLVQCVMAFVVGVAMFPVNILVVLSACGIASYAGVAPQELRLVVFGSLVALGPIVYALHLFSMWCDDGEVITL